MGIVFDIKRYAIHDGPGIRTTIFFKGCNLDCKWCHNPESKEISPEFMWWPNRCIGCRSCVSACNVDAIHFYEKLKVDENKCNMCGDCVEACYSEALKLIGKEMTIEEVMSEIRKDAVFFDESGGGVTFSGGEPLYQPEFLYKLLKACKKEGFHTAVDTCGYAESSVVSKISNLVDLWLYDLKHMEPECHLKYTGVSNEIILNNLQLLKNRNVLLRIPLVPGVNDDDCNIREISYMAKELGLKEISLLPYHKAGTVKSERLNRSIDPPFITEPTDPNRLEEVKAILEGCGLRVRIGD